MTRLPTHRGRTRFSLGLAATLLLGMAAAHASAAGRDPAQTLIDNGTTAQRSDPEASRRYAEEALSVLKRRPDVDLAIRARLLLCDYYSERDLAAAHTQIDAANALLGQATRKGLRSGILTCQGETAETAGNNAVAMRLFDQAVDVAVRTTDDQMLAEALFSRGYLAGLQGNYANGLADLRRSQSLYERLQMPMYALTVLDTVATTYNRMGDYEQAAQIYERAVTQQRAADMRRDEAVTLHNLARARVKLGEWDAARAGFAGCLALSQQLHYTRGQAYALLGLATVANSTGDPRGALATLQRAAALQQQTPDVRLNAKIQLARGKALRQLSRWDEALPPLNQAMAVFKQANSQDELGDVYTELALVHAQLGDWRSAYEYRSASQATAERLLHNQLDQRFATLKVEFDTATKEKENALLLRENVANQQALAQQRRAANLGTTVILLSAVLLGLLTLLVLRQRRGTRRMQVLAMTDELTGLPNRRAVLSRLETLLAQGGAGSCSMLIIDIDHFKSINDRHGHPVGDETLRLFTARIRDAINEPAFLGRLGGEEFAVVLPATGLIDAQRIAEQLRLQAPQVDLSRWLADRRISVSIGVTTATRHDTLSGMLRRADAALYAAKDAGRNCVRTEPATVMDEPALLPWRDTRTA